MLLSNFVISQKYKYRYMTLELSHSTILISKCLNTCLNVYIN